MNGKLLVEIFLEVVAGLMQEPRLYAFSNSERFINFRSEDFKKKLKEVVLKKTGKRKIKPFLDSYKILQWFISDKDRYTTVQKINGKSVRVLTVDKQKYDILESLTWE